MRGPEDSTDAEQVALAQRVFEHLRHEAGYELIALVPGTKQPAKGGLAGCQNPGLPRIPTSVVQASFWVLDRWNRLDLAWFPASPIDESSPPLVVVDLDDLDGAELVLETFGPTPFRVRHRGGRGEHWFYRAPDRVTKIWPQTKMFGPDAPAVDIKSWNSLVVAPYSRHAKSGEIYLPYWHHEDGRVQLLEPEELQRACINSPVFAAEKAEELRQSREAISEKVVVDLAERGIVRRGRSVSDPAYRGSIRSDFEVVLPDGTQTTLDAAIPPGRNRQRVWPSYRVSGSPSAEVYKSPDGIAFFTDYEDDRRYRVETAAESAAVRFDDSDVAGAVAREFPDAEIVQAPPETDLDLPRRPGVTVLATRLGSGKTNLLSRWVSEVDTALLVSVLKTLVEHLAHRVGATPYREVPHDAETQTLGERPRKVASTLNSLSKCDRRCQIFAIDEFDDVIDYARSGNVADAGREFRTLLERAAATPETVLASADTTARYVLFMLREIRKISPSKPIRLVVEGAPKGLERARSLLQGKTRGPFPATGRRAKKVAVRSLATTKNNILAAVARGERTVVMADRCAMIRHLAWGLAKLHPEKRIVWVSSENSRYLDVVELFSGGVSKSRRDALDLEGVDVAIFSPSVKSGVSITQKFDRLCLLYNGTVGGEAIGQMVGRCRAVQDVEIGSGRYEPKAFVLDPMLLWEDLRKKREKAIAQAELHGAGGSPIEVYEPLTLAAVESKLRENRFRSDRFGMLEEILGRRHGWSVSFDLDDPTPVDLSTWTAVIADGKAAADRATAFAVATARDVAPGTLAKKHIFEVGEIEQLEKAIIREFYDLPSVSVEDALQLDEKHREQCRRFARLWLYVQDPSALIRGEWTSERLRQPSEQHHAAERAALRADLVEAVLGGCLEGGNLETHWEAARLEKHLRAEVDIAAAVGRVVELGREWRDRWRLYFGGDPPGEASAAERRREAARIARPNHRPRKTPLEAASVRRALVAMGCTVTRSKIRRGAQGGVRWGLDWTEVFRWSAAERGRLVQNAQRADFQQAIAQLAAGAAGVGTVESCHHRAPPEHPPVGGGEVCENPRVSNLSESTICQKQQNLWQITKITTRESKTRGRAGSDCRSPVGGPPESREPNPVRPWVEGECSARLPAMVRDPRVLGSDLWGPGGELRWIEPPDDPDECGAPPPPSVT